MSNVLALSSYMLKYGLVETVEEAHSLIHAGRVLINGRTHKYPNKRTSLKKGTQGTKLVNTGWRTGETRVGYWMLRPQDIKIVKDK